MYYNGTSGIDAEKDNCIGSLIFVSSVLIMVGIVVTSLVLACMGIRIT